MRKSILTMLLALIIVLGTFGIVSAQGSGDPDGNEKQILWCSAIPGSQMLGRRPDSGCRVPVIAVGASIEQGLMTVYRSAWTNRWTTESDSDLQETIIRAQGFLYLNDQLEDWCNDPNSGQHAACRTYGGEYGKNRQDGYHYFSAPGYVDQNFRTRDSW